MGGWVGAWKDGCMDWWMHGWMGGCMDGGTDELGGLSDR